MRPHKPPWWGDAVFKVCPGLLEEGTCSAGTVANMTGKVWVTEMWERGQGTV